MLGVLFTMCVLLPWVNHFHLMVQLNPLKILGQHPQLRKRDVFLWKWGNIYPVYSGLQAIACMAAVWAGLRLRFRGTFTISGSFKLLVGDLWLSRFYQTGFTSLAFSWSLLRAWISPKEQLLWLSLETDSGSCFVLCLKYLPPYDLSRSREVNSRPLPHCCIWHH